MMRRRRVPVSAWIAGGWLALVVLAAAVAPLIARYDPYAGGEDSLLPPLSPGHLLGTDDLRHARQRGHTGLAGTAGQKQEDTPRRLRVVGGRDRQMQRSRVPAGVIERNIQRRARESRCVRARVWCGEARSGRRRATADGGEQRAQRSYSPR